MSAKPAWLRSLAAVVAWSGVTAVAAAGSWLGMSTVLTADPFPASAATVVAPSGDTSPSEKSSKPRSRTEPSPSEDSSSPREEWNGWTSVGDGAYERSFDTGGGTAVIRLLPKEAIFVSASPAEGYTARKEWPEPNHLVITFHASGSKVTIDTMWREGQPWAEVSET